MEGHLLQDIVTIFGLSIAVLLICHRLRIPSIVGFLVTGVVCGPYATGLVRPGADVQLLAEIGVVLLLFSVGLEFSLKRLLEHKRFFLIGGALQVGISILIGYVVAQFIGRPFGESIFLGFLLSLSSTAIVLRMLDRRQELTTPHGKVIIGILIFQDIAVVPMMLITPYLAMQGAEIDRSLLYYFIEGVVILGGVFFLATKLMPRLMLLIARTRSRELFLLTTLTICFAVAWIAGSFGLSLPLGAFLAGLIVSETEYRNEAIEDILPFQDVFTSFFFVSIGMLLNLNFIIEYPFTTILVTFLILFFKFSIITFVTLLTGMSLRIALTAGLALSQVGEFSFVLARGGMQVGIASEYYFQLFLAVAVLTMAITPFLYRLAHVLEGWVSHLPIPDKIISGYRPLKKLESKGRENHVVIVGYGLPGRVLASACAEAQIPYAIIDLDPNLIVNARKEGEPIYYGDATHTSVLEEVNVRKAEAIAILINDPLSTLRTLEHVRHLNESAYVIVRARWMNEVQALFQLGADDVIPDEFGVSIEVFARILRKNNINPEEIARIVAEKRHEEFEMIRHLYKEPETLLSISELGIGAIKVGKRSAFSGKTLAEIQLKEHYSVNPVMIRRGETTQMNLKGENILQEEDIIVIVGSEENIKLATKELSG